MHQPNRVQPPLVFRSRRGKHISVSGRVHHHLGENRLPPRLALEHHPANDRAFHHHIRHPAMQQHFYPRLPHHLVHHKLGRFRIGRRVVLPRPLVDDPAFNSREPFQQLIANPAQHLHQLSVLLRVRAYHQQHQPARPLPAKVAVSLHQCRLHSRPRRRDRRRETRRSSSDHQHVGLIDHCQRPLRLHHLPSHQHCRIPFALHDRHQFIFRDPNSCWSCRNFIRHDTAGKGRSKTRRREPLDQLASRERVLHTRICCTKPPPRQWKSTTPSAQGVT